MRQFCPTWFKGPYSQWLEYIIKADAAFCLCCYLFKNELESRGNGGDAFTKDGFRGWNKAVERLKAHVGDVNDIHHKCFNRMQDLKNQRQSILSSFDKQREKVKSDYRMRLKASIDVARFLLRSGFPFRGHDEREDSEYKGPFLELLEWHGDMHPDVKKVILRHAPQNDMMICPTIQKEIVETCAKETTKAIIEDLGGDFFGILVDESKDISHKEQMALILRYVNKSGMIIERFLGIFHVSDTSSQPLQKEIYSLLLKHSLSPSKIRGQGYDGATLPKKHSNVDNFFYVVPNVLNTIGASFKRRDSLRQHQLDKLEELIKVGEVLTGQDMKHECLYHLDRFSAQNLLSMIQEFAFVFMLNLMFKVLLLTNELNKVLQKKDQDIVISMGMLDLAKKRLQKMREEE
ncbi:uncharacterized protein LOC107759905 [Nicotiana tabacum]|uniref:Uncharacterized protein LOC107759905 n=1 Tax=Nicotiana tabacum TaxID=4097 RepID=A0AC58RR12_TOBAC